MNTFNLKRFWNYAKRDFYYSRNYYLGIVGILAGIFVLTMIFHFLDQKMESRAFCEMIQFAGIMLFLVAPLIMEEKRYKKQAIFSNILPVSNVEKFLNFWLKYVVIVQLICWITVVFLSTIYSYSTGNEYTSIVNGGTKDFVSFVKMFLGLHSLALLGYYFFKKYALVKTGTSILVALLIFYFVVSISYKILGIQHFNPTNDYFAPLKYFNWLEIPASPVIYVIHYIFRLIFPFGIWFVTYLKLKETEI